MEFLHNVVGPDFDLADLVTFDFGDVNFIMSLPKHCEQGGQKVLSATDLTQISGEHWKVDGDGNKMLTLAEHRWRYKDKFNELNVFLTDLLVLLKEIPAEKQTQSIPLNKPAFSNWIVESMHRSVELMEQQSPSAGSLEQAIKDWQIPTQVTDMETIKRDALDWMLTTLGHEGMGSAPPYVFIPLNRQYVILMTIESSKMSHSHIPDTFPEKDIEPVKRQIMMEFLNHVRIEYSPEILDEIKQQNPL